MPFHYTYILQSQKDKHFYYGSSQNLQQRLKQHNSGSVRSTKHRKPMKLVYYEAIPSKKRALVRERYFKTSWGQRFIKKQIGQDNYPSGVA